MKESRSYSEIADLDTEHIIKEFDTMNHILDRRKLIPFKGTLEKPGKNVIKIIVDRTCSMATVRLNNKPMMEGNFHDFHPGCHGGTLRVLGLKMNTAWHGYSSLANLMKSYIEKCKDWTNNVRTHADTTVVIEKYTGTYTDSGNWRNIKPSK